MSFLLLFLKGEVVRRRNSAQEDERNQRARNGLQETVLKISQEN